MTLVTRHARRHVKAGIAAIRDASGVGQLGRVLVVVSPMSGLVPARAYLESSQPTRSAHSIVSGHVANGLPLPRRIGRPCSRWSDVVRRAAFTHPAEVDLAVAVCRMPAQALRNPTRSAPRLDLRIPHLTGPTDAEVMRVADVRRGGPIRAETPVNTHVTSIYRPACGSCNSSTGAAVRGRR